MSLSVAAFTGFGIGLALSGAPGAVQALLLNESARGGVPRGLQAWAGTATTFGAMLAALALGFAFSPPSTEVVRGLRVVGALLLVFLAIDGFRSAGQAAKAAPPPARLPPFVLGSLAILLNPGAWLFGATVAGPLFRTAAGTSGTFGALVCALALLGGAAGGDVGVVLVGGLGIRRSTIKLQIRIRRILACGLGGFALWLLGSSVIA
jgi:threonine/homoserine/homoserine lactone efflux protein